MKSKFKKGQLLLEALLAISLIVIIIPLVAQMIFVSVESNHTIIERDVANSLALEVFETVRLTAFENWLDIYQPPDGAGNAITSKGEANHYQPTQLSGAWTITSGEEDVVVGGVTYTRYFTIDNVSRDASTRDIEPTYVTLNDDPSTQKITTHVLWGGYSLEWSEYMYRWGNKVCYQTQWSSVAVGPVSCPVVSYDSIVSSLSVSTPGEIALETTATVGTSTWLRAGEQAVVDNTNLEFGAGTFDDTTVVGSGTGGSVVLGQAPAWVEHADSRENVVQDLNDMDEVSSSDIWAVGKTGDIIHYDGTNWTEVSSPSTKELNGVVALSPSNAWAVGNGGEILHYSGGSWSTFSSPTTSNINAIDSASPSNIWAVGDGGEILHYSPSSWSTFSSPTTSNLNSVFVVSGNDIWAVGDGGVIIHYNGTSWLTVTSATSANLNSVTASSASDAWAVGAGGEMVHYTGTSWVVEVSPTTGKLNAVSAVSSSDVWAVGAGWEIFQYNGTSWSVSDSPTGQELFDILAISTANIWTVGRVGTIFQYSDSFYVPTGTFISRVLDSVEVGINWNIIFWLEDMPSGADITISTRTGTTPTVDGSWSSWSAEKTDNILSSNTSPDGRYIQYRATLTRGDSGDQTPELQYIALTFGSQITDNINAIDAASSSDIWVVGKSGHIGHYDGVAWETYSPPPTSQDLLSISVVSSNDAWAVGKQGVIIHFDGAEWLTVTSPITQSINTIGNTASSTSIWAAGNSGKIIHYDGVSWTEYADTGNTTWSDIHMVADDDGWLVGNSGKIYHYDGNSWSQYDDTGNATWNSVYMVSSTDGWAVGGAGKIYRYADSAWSQDTDTGAHTWNSVHMSSLEDGWVVGAAGTIHHYDGLTWSEFLSPTAQDLNEVIDAGTSDLWAVGNTGTILHLIQSSGEALGSSGTIFSSVIDLGVTAGGAFNSILWKGELPAGTIVRLQLASSNSSSGPWSFIGGATCSIVDYYTPDPGIGAEIGCYSTHNNKRYFRYSVQLCSATNCIDNNGSTPIVRDVVLGWTP